MNAAGQTNAGYGYTGLADSGRDMTWREQEVLFLRCREETEEQLKTGWNGRTNELDGNVVPGLCRKYGPDAVGTFLSYNVYRRTSEPGITWDVRGWSGAFRTKTPDKSFGDRYVAKIPAAALNGMVMQYRSYVRSIRLHGEESVLPGSRRGDFEGKLLVLRPEKLQPGRENGDWQFFFATGGYGCAPGNPSSRVYGLRPADGSGCFFCRRDFLGVSGGQDVPGWISDRVSEMRKQYFAGPEEDELTLLYENEDGPWETLDGETDLAEDLGQTAQTFAG